VDGGLEYYGRVLASEMEVTGYSRSRWGIMYLGSGVFPPRIAKRKCLCNKAVHAEAIFISLRIRDVNIRRIDVCQ